MEDVRSIKNRSINFQKIDLDSIQRKQEGNAVELRKKKRFEVSQHRRMLKHTFQENPLFSEGLIFRVEWIPTQVRSYLPRLADESLEPETRYEILLNSLQVHDSILLELLIILKNILSSDLNTSITLLFEHNVHLVLISILKQAPSNYQTECAWSLINLTNNDSAVHLLLNEGLLEILESLLISSNKLLVFQSIWILGNIAFEYRDKVAKQTPKILRVLSQSLTPYYISICLYTLAMLVKSKPLPVMYPDIVKKTKPFIEHEDSKIQYESLKIMACVSNEDIDSIQSIISSGVTPQIIELCSNSSENLQTIAVRIVGNLLTGDHLQTQYILSKGFLDTLKPLLEHHNLGLKKEAFWILSNILAGTVEQIQCVLKHECYYVLIENLRNHSCKIRKEALWCFRNLTLFADHSFVFQSVVNTQAFFFLAEKIDESDACIVVTALKCILNLLSAGEKIGYAYLMNEAVVKFSSIGCVESLEKLQFHSNRVIHNLASEVLQKFYPQE